MAVKTFGSERLVSTDINTYLANSGLDFVKSQTVGSGVSSVTVSNAFSATWDNYRIVMSGGTQSINGATNLILGSSTSNYNAVLIYGNVAGTPALAGGTNSASFLWIGGGRAGQQSHTSLDLFGPFLTQYTKSRNGSYQDADNFGVSNGEHTLATSYTSFTISLTGGTFTGGSVVVYGYRKP